MEKFFVSKEKSFIESASVFLLKRKKIVHTKKMFLKILFLVFSVRRKRSEVEWWVRLESELNSVRHRKLGELHPLTPIPLREHVPSLHRSTQHLQEAALSGVNFNKLR
jgi:hypothetical protein